MVYSMERNIQTALNYTVPKRKSQSNLVHSNSIQSTPQTNDVDIVNSILHQRKQPNVEELMRHNQYYVSLLNKVYSKLLDSITFYDMVSKDEIKKMINEVLDDLRGEKE
jgi:hypothetical protein